MHHFLHGPATLFQVERLDKLGDLWSVGAFGQWDVGVLRRWGLLGRWGVEEVGRRIDRIEVEN